MALTSTSSSFYWPPIWGVNSPGTLTLSVDTHYVGHVFQAPATTNLIDVHFRTGGTVTNGGSSFTGGLYAVDASTGYAGTQVGSNFTAITTGLTTGTNYNFGGGLSYAVTKGSIYAVKLFRTVGDAFNGQIAAAVIVDSQVPANNRGFPYRIANVGSDAKSSSALSAAISLEFTGNTFYPGIATCCATSATVSTASNGTIAVGIKFKLPFAARCSGLWFAGVNNTNTVTGTFNLGTEAYAPGDTGATRLALCSTWDEDVTTGGEFVSSMIWDGGAEVILSANTWYRLVFRNETTTGNNVRYVTSAPSAAHLRQLVGQENLHYCSYASGSWTDTTTSLCAMGLLLNAIDHGGGNPAFVLGV